VGGDETIMDSALNARNAVPDNGAAVATVH
jgi:hypothetical protein